MNVGLILVRLITCLRRVSLLEVAVVTVGIAWPQVNDELDEINN